MFRKSVLPENAQIRIIQIVLLSAFFLLLKTSSFGQGRVVVNEYMAWSGCNTTSEFIELLNFGPGPMNIGCYVVTNGQYSVTIPPNTILKAGQYFILSGQDILANGCGNTDSTVHVDLNWETCNCTNTAIPATGDGFMKDGGSANEKIVLFDPSLNVVDAVTRKTPVTSSVTITTPTLSGGCSSKTFNLDNMNISYETIGQSTGVNNSYSRQVDGDCGWVKTPAISAHAANKTGNTSSVTYDFSTLTASDCNGAGGYVSIGLTGTNLSSLFPMNYILAYDKDSNNVFDFNDQYTYGVDSTPSSIDVGNLAYGRYRITVSSALGCNLKTFDFFIFNCYGVLLPFELLSFKYEGIKETYHSFECQIQDVASLQKLVLEASDGFSYKEVANASYSSVGNGAFIIKTPLSFLQYYRLRITSNTGKTYYSPILNIGSLSSFATNKLWPNPAQNQVNVALNSEINQVTSYTITSLNNNVVQSGNVLLKQGGNVFQLPVSSLKSGIYQLTVFQTKGNQPISFRFVKQ